MSHYLALQAIDHVEVSVPDRHEAVDWYSEVLGLEIMQGTVWGWAVQLPEGPLFLSSPDLAVKVALFEGEPLAGRPPIGLTRAAFRVDGETFVRFAERLEELDLRNDEGERVTIRQLNDHLAIWAYYFNDPYGNRYELNTYDYELVRQRLPEARERAPRV